MGSEEEVLCVVNWFRLWTPAQRDHFLNLLLAKLNPHHPEAQLLESTQRLSLHGLSLPVFECQLNLFSRYYDNWLSTQRDLLLVRLVQLDSSFAASLQAYSSAYN
ncbi:Protein of unknown function DUF4508 [Trinorchestia longiramus]|nr:Protein of unknown function DUF4508 [Trinorchestia longiramus]